MSRSDTDLFGRLLVSTVRSPSHRQWDPTPSRGSLPPSRAAAAIRSGPPCGRCWSLLASPSSITAPGTRPPPSRHQHLRHQGKLLLRLLPLVLLLLILLLLVLILLLRALHHRSHSYHHPSRFLLQTMEEEAKRRSFRSKIPSLTLICLGCTDGIPVAFMPLAFVLSDDPDLCPRTKEWMEDKTTNSRASTTTSSLMNTERRGWRR